MNCESPRAALDLNLSGREWILDADVVGLEHQGGPGEPQDSVQPTYILSV